MEKKENRRVRMTKKLLTESFLKFLSEKPLSKITIKEICEDADLNRSTYYTYYTDPYDQLRKLEDEMIFDMHDYVDSIGVGKSETVGHQKQVVRSILEYIHSRKQLFQVLLGENGDNKFEQKMLSHFEDLIFHKDFFDEKAIKRKEYQYVYASTGSLGMIHRWILEDDDVDLETMAEWLTELNSPLNE